MAKKRVKTGVKKIRKKVLRQKASTDGSGDSKAKRGAAQASTKDRKTLGEIVSMADQGCPRRATSS